MCDSDKILFILLSTAVEDNVQRMKSTVNSKTALKNIPDNSESQTLITSFDNLNHELAAFADVYKLTMSSSIDAAASSFSNQTLLEPDNDNILY